MMFIDLLIIIFGLCIGSFYNVVALRLLKGQSLVFPPSHCPQCRHRLGVGDLLPLLSYVLLRGRCRYCRAPISVLYPLGEGMTALSFYLVYRQWGFQWELAVGWVLASLLVLASLTDLKARMILDHLIFTGFGLLVLLRTFIGDQPWWWYIVGGLMGSGLLLLGARLSRGGISGDIIKLVLAVGVALGPWSTMFSIGLAALAGTLAGAVMMWSGFPARRRPLPLAPFVWFGAMTAYIYGDDLWRVF